MKRIIYALFFFSCQAALAQDFNISKVEVAGDKVNIYYDLVDSTSRRTYTVKLLSSRDNFISPIEKASGDVGLEVRPGLNRKITWNAKEDLGNAFQGAVSVEVRGRVYIPFVRLRGDYSSMKRLKQYEMTWTGGTEQNILNFDLYRNGNKVTTFSNIANVGHYTLTLPANIKPGNGYSFRITDTKNQDQIVNTAPFSVKRKFPLVVKLIPLVVIGVIIGTHKSAATVASSIPDAPGHP